MAELVGYFKIINPDGQEWFGGYVAKNSGEIRSGILCKINPDGTDAVRATVQPTGAGEKPAGIAYSDRTWEFAPSSVYLNAGEMVTLIKGANLRFLADVYSFTGGVLPAAGAAIYTGANGLLALTGAAAGYVGRCVGLDAVPAPILTTNNLVMCEAQFLI